MNSSIDPVPNTVNFAMQDFVALKTVSDEGASMGTEMSLSTTRRRMIYKCVRVLIVDSLIYKLDFLQEQQDLISSKIARSRSH